MATGASAEDSLPNDLHPPAITKAAAAFESYAAYLAKLDRSPATITYSLNEDLWLASFNGEGRCMEWNYYNPSPQARPGALKTLPNRVVDERNVRPHASALSHDEFRGILQTPDEKVIYRIVIATSKSRGIPSPIKDIVGLGLDLGPEIFDYAQNWSEDSVYVERAHYPRPWFKDPPALRIGENVLCILEATPGKAPKTAILFLASNVESRDLVAKHSTDSVIFASKRPSQTRETFDLVFEPRHYNTWLIQRLITSGTGLNDHYGSGNYLYVCLAALMELHLSTAPFDVPVIGERGLEPEIPLKYRGHYVSQRDGVVPYFASPGIVWARLRMQVDEERAALRWITRFFRKHFDQKNHNLHQAFDDIIERFKLRVQDLEQSESELRDHLAVQSTGKSIEMAEMSIRESKRVMLLTALAFFFLPFSLASSIYGMNVQQINGTGHSITAFMITGFAMCGSSVALWAMAAAFQSYRARLILRHEFNRYRDPSPYDHFVMRGPLKTLQSLWSEFRLQLR